MQIDLRAQKKDAPPVFPFILEPVINWSDEEALSMVVAEGVMASGEPAVYILCQKQSEGTIILATSLDKLMMAAAGLAGMAEKQFGWKRPEGSATLLPPLDPEMRKQMLEAIKKELEEWEDAGQDA